MSNTEASRVYELIVESVVNEVREDFENAGIDEQTLQDLKQVWQTKLSETKVTKFSWDPQENEGQLGTDGMDNDGTNAFNGLNESSNTGSKTNAVPSEYSLNESQGLVLPGFPNEEANKTESSATINETPNGQENKVEEPVANQQQEQAQEARNEGNEEDIRDREDQKVKTEQDRDNNLDDSQQIELTISYGDSEKADALKQESKKAKRSALLDADEVGSELDDSDDDYLISEGEEDGPDENLMLCLYDKVTRAKARWKCSLKDGIVTINRKDFTFQKSQVEAEWV
ncbi:hypothetical protein HG535_0A03930 [Zygotorulaspora mrakii]|uniref:Transcription initiation factor IIA large subunit n=1 Tax=Zygotorulaspora mrakii TaxID=42260 RepID=A0A7H9AWH8_ZYGMR|nr:uncharacterized protein HG535_0A03930 [Zygotorulaspora mrakii]QLG70454.1 hypothetical protein HG535_0A03930 [Zygotorulaspora mrakii]